MTNKPSVSRQTRSKRLLVFLLTINGLLIIASSIYFLFLPNGDYQGGRNPTYGIVILYQVGWLLLIFVLT